MAVPKFITNDMKGGYVGGHTTPARRCYVGGTLVYQGFSPASEREFIQQEAPGGPAKLLKVYGKTIVNNQLVDTPHLTGTSTASWQEIHFTQFPVTTAHKYALLLANWTNLSIRVRYPYISGTITANSIITPTADGNLGLQYIGPAGSYGAVDTYVYIIDLTLLYGAGHEPTSVAQFLADYPTYNPTYDPGSLQSNKTAELRAERIPVINVWDEEWEVGEYSESTGQKSTTNDRIRSANMMQVTPNASYYIKYGGTGNYIYIFEYDAAKTYLGTRRICATNNAFTTSANAYYINFTTYPAYGTTYNNDICINLSDPAINGTYYPHWRGKLTLNIPTLTSGGVAVFPDGMAGFNGHYDEAYNRVAIRRLALKVFDGTETWGSTSLQVDGYFTTAQRYDLLGMKFFANVSAISNKFPYYNNTASACFWFGGTGNSYFYVRVPNSIATDNASLQTWLAAQYAAGTPFEVEYVLNTEEPLLLDTPLPTDLTCEQDDILQRVSDNNCPFVGEMKFGL